MALPRTVLGVMEFGRQLSEEQCHELVKIFMQDGHRELDNARMYVGGKSEEIMGRMSECRDKSMISVATKAYPDQGFTYDGLISQLNASLQALQTPSVDIFYLHWPDKKVPVEETLRAVNQLYLEGKFVEFGLSNYASWQVVEIYYICRANGWILPTVYQGMYNSLTRNVERELIPALRKLGMRFYAYNPLAGGLLTGRYAFEDMNGKCPAGRFFTVGGKWSKNYRDRYWKESYFQGIDIINKALEKCYKTENVSLLEASLRWMYHHSQLSGEKGDGVILGASKVPHLVANLSAIKGGPLHKDVVEAFDEAWNGIDTDCPNYFR